MVTDLKRSPVLNCSVDLILNKFGNIETIEENKLKKKQKTTKTKNTLCLFYIENEERHVHKMLCFKRTYHSLALFICEKYCCLFECRLSEERCS
jgi:hypothetical protein